MSMALPFERYWPGAAALCMSHQLPSFERTAAKALADALGVRFEPWMQDWPLEVADSARVEEFLAAYEKEERPEHRLAIMELIIASSDQAFSLGPPLSSLLDRVAAALKAYPELVEYWSCLDAHSDDEMFAITPWMRGL
jgi:hypothetical protein